MIFNEKEEDHNHYFWLKGLGDYIVLVKIQGMAEEIIRTYYYRHKYFMKFIGYDIKYKDIDISLLNNYRMMLLDRKIKVTINGYLSNIRPI